MTSLIASLGTVLRKELLDGIRDRRSIISALVPLAFLPVMVFFAVKMASDQVEAVREITVPVAGASRAQPLVDWLERQHGVEVEPAPEEHRRQVRDGELGFVVVFADDFAQRFGRSKTAKVEILVDSRDSHADRAADRVRTLIREYSQLLAAQRLLVRGVSPEVIRPVEVETVDIATDQERAARFLMFMPLMLLMAVFIGGLQIAIDSTSGERERRTLESLLSKPVPNLSVVMGKWLASGAFSVASIVLTCALMLLALEIAPLHRLSIRHDLGLGGIALLLVAVLPLVPFVSALQITVATLARSYKEAQSYVSFLMFLPILPMLIMTDPTAEQAAWKLLVPVLGQFILILDVMKGSAVSPLTLVVPTLISLVGGGVFLAVTARLFRSERIVFGR